MKPKEMERLILKDGWYFDRAKGSHRQYRHPAKEGIVTIPFHNRDLKLLTQKSIEKQAGLK